LAADTAVASVAADTAVGTGSPTAQRVAR